MTDQEKLLGRYAFVANSSGYVIGRIQSHSPQHGYGYEVIERAGDLSGHSLPGEVKEHQVYKTEKVARAELLTWMITTWKRDKVILRHGEARIRNIFDSVFKKPGDVP